MTVHRPDPECNTNEPATATIPASVLAANVDLLARRAERARKRAAEHTAEGARTPDPSPQTTEPTPNLRAAQISHDFAGVFTTSQDATNAATQRTRREHPKPEKPLAGKTLSPVESIVAEMIGSGAGAERAVAAALRFATKHRHGIQTCADVGGVSMGGFNSDGIYEPGEGNARAFTFVRTLLHAPTFNHTRGNGLAFVDRLRLVLGVEGVNLIAAKLWCDVEDLVLAADRVRVLLGENLLAVAASAMHRVMIPPHVLVRIQDYPNVYGVVLLVAALAEQNGKRDGTAFVSQHDAATILGKAPGAISRAFSIAVRLGVLERVSQGHRKHANATGVASVYRVPWIANIS